MRGEDDQAIEVPGAAADTVARVVEVAAVADEQAVREQHEIGSARCTIDRLEPELKWKTPADDGGGVPVHGELMASATSTADMRRAFEYETATYRGTGDARRVRRWGTWWIRPLAEDSFARRLSMQAQLLPTVEAKDWQEVSAVTLERAADISNLGNVVLSISLPRYVAVGCDAGRGFTR